jgi:hypothetical protein
LLSNVDKIKLQFELITKKPVNDLMINNQSVEIKFIDRVNKPTEINFLTPQEENILLETFERTFEQTMFDLPSDNLDETKLKLKFYNKYTGLTQKIIINLNDYD